MCLRMSPIDTFKWSIKSRCPSCPGHPSAVLEQEWDSLHWSSSRTPSLLILVPRPATGSHMLHCRSPMGIVIPGIPGPLLLCQLNCSTTEMQRAAVSDKPTTPFLYVPIQLCYWMVREVENTSEPTVCVGGRAYLNNCMPNMTLGKAVTF